MTSWWLVHVTSCVLLIVSITACATEVRQSGAAVAAGERSIRVIDLSQKLTTFRPSPSTAADKRFTADLTTPVGASRAAASFTDQMLLVQNPDFPTGDGLFKLNTTVLPENVGTSMDTGSHFVPNRFEVANPDRRGLADLTVEDLTGPVVFIDISARVDAELKRNNGAPGSTQVTNFGDASANVVTAADIDAVATQLRDRSFVIVHTGWSRFYSTSGPGLEGPYVNGFNYPGVSREAIARLIDVETSRSIKINGIGVDNLTVDAGENAGAPKFGPGAFPAHLRGLQRGWKLLENLTNTAELGKGPCKLFVGAMNHIGGVASWARIFASCG
jgi:kynurenine formamidase